MYWVNILTELSTAAIGSVYEKLTNCSNISVYVVRIVCLSVFTTSHLLRLKPAILLDSQFKESGSI